jgi:hypothetical protein
MPRLVRIRRVAPGCSTTAPVTLPLSSRTTSTTRDSVSIGPSARRPVGRPRRAAQPGSARLRDCPGSRPGTRCGRSGRRPRAGASSSPGSRPRGRTRGLRSSRRSPPLPTRGRRRRRCPRTPRRAGPRWGIPDRRGEAGPAWPCTAGPRAVGRGDRTHADIYCSESTCSLRTWPSCRRVGQPSRRPLPERRDARRSPRCRVPRCRCLRRGRRSPGPVLMRNRSGHHRLQRFRMRSGARTPQLIASRHRPDWFDSRVSARPD